MSESQRTESNLRDLEVIMPGGEIRRFGDLAPGAALVVNVASKCGHTPQYAGLEALHREFGPRGLTVIGMPCNQFMFQEPGSDAEIAAFCSANYGVTFPLLAKGKVNGRGATPLYRELVKAEDAKGEAGKVHWNFEKFVIGRDPADGGARHDGARHDDARHNGGQRGGGQGGGDGGPMIARFRPEVEPEDPALRDAIEAALSA